MVASPPVNSLPPFIANVSPLNLGGFAAVHESAIGTKRTSELHRTCPLLGVKQTSLFALHMSAYDPKRTSTASINNQFCAGGSFSSTS